MPLEPSPRFAAFARLIIRLRVLVLLLTAAVIAGSVWVILTRIEIDTSVEAFSASDNAPQRTLEELRDEFGQEQLLMLLVEGDVFTMDYLRRLEALHQTMEAADVELSSVGERKQDRFARRNASGVEVKRVEAGEPDLEGFGAEDEGWGGEAGGGVFEEVTSLINARKTQRTPEGLLVGSLLDPLPAPEELPALEARILADPTLVGQVVGPEGDYALVLLRAPFLNQADMRLLQEHIEGWIAPHQAEGFAISVSGGPAMTVGLNRLMFRDLRVLLSASLGVMLLLLVVIFRHPLGVIPPLIVVVISTVNAFALMAVLKIPVTMLSNVLPGFLFCVGVGDAVHLQSVYRDHLKRHGDNHAAIVHAVSSTGVPILYTSLTTMVGLYSFRFASMGAIQDVGLVGAFGVGMAMIHSLLFVPAVLTFNRGGLLGAREGAEADRLDAALQVALAASADPGDDGVGPERPAGRRRRRLNLALGGALLGGSLIGVSLLHVWHHPMSWIPEDQETRITFEKLDRKAGGAGLIQLLVDGGSERGVKDKALLEGLERLIEHIRAFEDEAHGRIVGNAISIIDVIKETHRALHGGGAAQYRLPETQRGINDHLFLFESAGADQLHRLATEDLKRTQVTLRVRWLEATAYRGLDAHIKEGIARYIPKDARVRPTGNVYALMSTIDALITDLLRSFGVAFLVITLLMILLLKDLKLGLLAMVPNLLPIAFLMGLMGWTGIPIDLNNLLLASISIGIAVDATIHLLHQFRLELERTGNVEVAIHGAMDHSGRAIVSTGLILMLGFFVFLGADMANLARFGLLVGLTCVVALIIDLVFTPALLRTIYRGGASKT